MTTVLDEVPLSIGWTEVPFRAIANKVSEPGYGHLDPLSVYLDAGVVPRSSRVDNHNQLGENIEKYQRVLPNDLVFNKLRTWQGGFGISGYEGIVSPAYIIARPIPGAIDPRFLGYLLKSAPYLAELTRLSKWMPPSQFDISWDSIRDLRLRIPKIEEQGRIADYLDHKTSILQRVIDNSNAILALTSENLNASISHKFESLDNEPTELRRVAKLNSSKKLASLQTVSLDLVLAKRGCLVVDDLPITSGDTSTYMDSGDVAFGKLRPYLGKVFLAIKPTFAESEFVVLRPDINALRPEFLRNLLLSRMILSELESLSVGAKMPRTSWDQISRLKIPLPSFVKQDQINQQIQELRDSAILKEVVLRSMLIALDEYKVSLITSVVTGTIKVNLDRSMA